MAQNDVIPWDLVWDYANITQSTLFNLSYVYEQITNNAWIKYLPYKNQIEVLSSSPVTVVWSLYEDEMLKPETVRYFQSVGILR